MVIRIHTITKKTVILKTMMKMTRKTIEKSLKRKSKVHLRDVSRISSAS